MAPVVIPALAPTLDKFLKEDRSLCPVQALRYYLDKTQDLRQGKELVFLSFKRGFTKDILPATILSWIKQMIILCYELSYQEALSLYRLGHMMLELLLLLGLFKVASPWTKF